MELDMSDCIFNRDENGKLIPIRDELIVGKSIVGDKKEDIKLQIKYLPITRGQYYKLLQLKESGNQDESDIDKSILFENLIEPKYTKEQLNDMNPTIFNLLITRIMARSFSVDDNIYKETKSAEDLDEFKKKR